VVITASHWSLRVDLQPEHIVHWLQSADGTSIIKPGKGYFTTIPDCNGISRIIACTRVFFEVWPSQ
jgi:hypothetical protein